MNNDQNIKDVSINTNKRNTNDSTKMKTEGTSSSYLNSIDVSNKSTLTNRNDTNGNNTIKNKGMPDRNTSNVFDASDTHNNVTNNNPSVYNSSSNRDYDERSNLVTSNIENSGRNTTNAILNVTNNNIVYDSYSHNSNDELDNREYNLINRPLEKTLSFDTVESTTYGSDKVVADSENISVSNIQVPIVGYEVMEERARFTVFKVKVEDLKNNRSWLVFRRYTDFVRLYTRLKSENININLPLPGKRWFRDNFEASFLEERVRGLQVFINTVVRRLGDNKTVREFLCVEEPPGTWGWQAEALAGALQDTVSSLRRELRQREAREENLVREIERLQEKISNCDLCKHNS